MDFFTNIFRYSKDQQLEFVHHAVFELLGLTSGFEHDCGAHIN